MSENIIVEKIGRVMKVTISREDKKNAITQLMYGAMADALDDYSADDELRAFVITGKGDMFTAGNDLSDFKTDSRGGEELPVTRFLRTIKDCPKPLIAAVNGAGIGIGLTLLLHCDLVFAVEGALLSAPFVGLGLVPEAASSKLLPELVGRAVANDIFMTGRRLSAEEALDFGLISRVFKAEDFEVEVGKLAMQVAGSAPSAMRHTKALVRHETEFVGEHMAREGVIFAEQLKSSEFAESVAAMQEKRFPVYK